MNTYQPDLEAARLAPACVCNVASRIIALRRKMNEVDGLGTPLFSDRVKKLLKPYLEPLPFEAELVSGKMNLVDQAIKKIGAL